MKNSLIHSTHLFLITLFLLTSLAGLTHPVVAQETVCGQPHLDVATPLSDLGDHEYVRMDGQATGFTGGLYPNGRNERPPDHEAAGLMMAQNVVPRDESGTPDPANGKIGMISVGMSNTSSEFNTFMNLIHLHPDVNPQVTAVNGAQGGRVADNWSAEETDVWHNLDGQLNHRRVTAEQVQVAWIKLTLTRRGDFPEKAEELERHLEIIVQELKERFPNLQMIYFSSRTRSYTYDRGLSPEPVAFETGFAVKWLIERQINGDPALNFDPTKGDVVAPYLSWGPYLWIDGENERSDGRVWLAEDMIEDCTHPSHSGRDKVAEMLLAFFLSDSTTDWFRAGFVPEVVPTTAVLPTNTAPPLPTETAVSATPTYTVTPFPENTSTTVPTDEPTATAVIDTVAELPAPTITPAPEVNTAVEPPTATPTWLWPVITVIALLIGTAVGWLGRGKKQP